jgi:serine/threonine-protein kinase/endoribonuclease IRE1
VCSHPAFWSSTRRLDFLVELSDRLEHEQPDSPLVLAIESNAPVIVGRSWDRRLHSGLLEDIGKYRKYDKSSVRDLLR